MKSLKITIITVSFNAVKTIERTILSVINQSYTNLEYIIVDGGSSDGTLDVIKQYAGKISKWISESDRGIYDAMNKGISMATGDVIGILNSDDILHDGNTVEIIADCYNNSDSLFILHGNINYVVNGVSHIRRPDDKIEKMKVGPVVFHPTMYVPKRIYEEVGYFSTSYKIASDYDMMLRIYMKGYTYRYIDSVVVDMSAGGASDKRKMLGFYECYKVTLKAGLNPVICTINYLKRVIGSYISL